MLGQICSTKRKISFNEFDCRNWIVHCAFLTGGGQTPVLGRAGLGDGLRTGDGVLRNAPLGEMGERAVGGRGGGYSGVLCE